MKALILAAAVAVGFVSYASAAEVKKDTTKAPVIAAKAMTDKDMDKVTAGYYVHTYNQGWNYNARVNYNGAIHGFQGNSGRAAYTSY
jgi:hypothetical protein